MKKWVAILIFLAVCLAGYFVYAKATEAIPLPAARAERGAIREFVDERGVTRLPKTHLVTMPYTGRIAEVVLDEGDKVRKGEVVAQLVQEDLELAVDAAEAAVARLKAAVKENEDKSVELTGLQQALQFVTSMDRTVEAALARVQSGKAKKDFAESQLKRVARLEEQNAVSDEDLERAEVAAVQSRVDFRQDELVHSAMVALQAATALMPTMVRQYIDRKNLSTDVLEQQQAEAEAKYSQALLDKRRGTIQSPIDGVVLERRITNERYITAGTVLLELGRLEDLQVEADVLSQDVVEIEVNDEVEIYGPAIGPTPAIGVVTRIFPAGFTKVSSLGVEQQRVKVVIDMTEDDLRRLIYNQDLGVGYRVRVRIFTAQKSGVLTIPRSALVRGDNGDWQVFAIRGGRAERVAIEIGLMNDEKVEVVSGLDLDEIVIVSPERELADGQRVDPQFRERNPDSAPDTG